MNRLNTYFFASLMLWSTILVADPMIEKMDIDYERGVDMETNIDISAQNRAASAAILNHLLCDEYVLYTKTLNYHWNIYGPDFKALHVFLQEQYEDLLQIVDDVAERVRSLGHVSFGTMTEFMKNTRLKEFPGDAPEALVMIKRLLDDHEAIICTLRVALADCDKKYNDMGTSNFLTDLMEKHEKMAWMLRATLQK